MESKSLFISQPMSGKTTDEILEVRLKAIKYIQEIYPDNNIVPIDSFHPTPDQDTAEYNPMSAVMLLGNAISKMSSADIIYFAPGWQKSRGCQIENEVARRWLEETGVELIEDGMEKIDIELSEEDLNILKEKAENAGMSIHKFVSLKLEQACKDGTIEKLVKELKHEFNDIPK